ncbi:MAG: OmpA family protein [Myxococcales bacterium]|nr:OmpA family protein [Myxococcales bacterium]
MPSTGDTGADLEVCAGVEGGGCVGGAAIGLCEEPGSGGGPQPTEPGAVLEGGGGGDGGGCSVVAEPSLSLGIWVLVLWWMRRAPWSLMAIALLPAWAGATDLNALQLLDGGPTPTIVDPRSAEPGEIRLQLGGSRATNPLRSRAGDAVDPIVDVMDVAEVALSVQIRDWFRLGASLPMVRVDALGTATTGLGDRTLFLVAPLGPSLAAEIRADIGARRTPQWAGQTSTTLGLVGCRSMRIVEVAGRFRIRLEEPQPLPGVQWGSRWEWAVGARTQGRVALGAEVLGSLPLGILTAPRSRWPMEALAFGHLRLVPQLEVRAGAGAGVTRGLGTPELRGFASMQWRSERRDDDGDGIGNLRDLCPQRPEDDDDFRDWDGCPDPDNDRDTFADAVDACPNDAEVFNDLLDDDGCPDSLVPWTVEVHSDHPLQQVWIRIDGDGGWQLAPRRTVALPPGEHSVEVTAPEHLPVTRTVELSEHAITTVVELQPVRYGHLWVRLVSEDGTPLVGTLQLAEAHEVPVSGALLRLTAGSHHGSARVDDHVDAQVRAVVPVQRTRQLTITLARRPESAAPPPILFALDSAELREEAIDLIDALAAWLTTHPDVLLLRVEGHADAVGSSAYNYALSQRRAQAVVAALVQRGIASERLTAVGSGEAEQVLAATPPEGFDLKVAGIAAREVTFGVIVWEEAPRR